MHREDCLLTRGADIDVDISDDILDGVDDFLEDESLAEFCLEHLFQICL